MDSTNATDKTKRKSEMSFIKGTAIVTTSLFLSKIIFALALGTFISVKETAVAKAAADLQRSLDQALVGPTD